MLENLLQVDSLLDQYDKMASGQKMPDDLTDSAILRCIDAPTRRHLEMVMDETYTYSKLKEKLILLGKNTKSWSGDSFLKSLQTIQNPATSSATTSQGPVPMEVDQVSYGHKGKGKNKGKSGKGKKGGWFGIPYGGKSYGHGKSKSKHKGKKGKSKNKGKQSYKGKGHGSGNNNTCRLCGQQGHWGNECPNRNNVSQVNEQGGAAQGQPVDAASDGGTTSTRRTSVGSASTTSQSTTSRASNVRRVKLYNVATPPNSGPEIFELESIADVEEWYSTCMVRSVDYEVFNMATGDEADGGEEWRDDPLYGWYGNIGHDFDKVKSSADDDVDWYHVRAVPLQDSQLIVLQISVFCPKQCVRKELAAGLGERCCKMRKVVVWKLMESVQPNLNVRRGRHLAREFRGNDHGTPETFAPTSGIGSRLVLLLHICLKWFLSFMDVKGPLPQQERVLVEKPVWRCGMAGERTGEEVYFVWRRIGTAADQDPKEPVRFLKKRHFFTGAGVVISPHEKYIEELVKAHRVENRKPKATPDIAFWNVLDGDELDDEEKHTFRSSMCTLSQDRVDIQHAVRNLPQWMSKPTRPAMDGVRHLVLYLKGTPTYGVFLPYTVPSNSKLEEIHGKSSSCLNG
eukprot:s2986_g13.t1